MKIQNASNVFERNLLLMCGQQPGPALAEGQGFIAAALHLAHEKDPEADQEKEGGPRNQCREPWALARLFACNGHLLLAEHVDQVRILHRHHGPEMLASGKGAFHIRVGNRDFFNVAALDFRQESAESVWLFTTC